MIPKGTRSAAACLGLIDLIEPVRRNPMPEGWFMPSIRPLVGRFVFALAFVVALSTAAEAADTRYVSTNGSNANACTRAAPCLTLQRGVNRTADGGTLVILDSGNYGNSFTIRKSITIIADGVAATLGNPGSVVVDAAGAVVVLRGLKLKGGSTDAVGIRILAAAAVHIEHCTIEGFRGPGSVLGSGIGVIGVDTNLFVAGSVLRNNDQFGLYFDPATTGGGKLTVDNSRFENNGTAGLNTGDAESTITRTVASSNGSVGIQILAGGRMNVTSTTVANNGTDGYRVVGGDLTLESSVARGNGAVGVYSHFASDIVRLSNSVITDNVTGLRNGGSMLTRGNNIVDGNTTDLVGDPPAPLAGS